MKHATLPASAASPDAGIAPDRPPCAALAGTAPRARRVDRHARRVRAAAALALPAALLAVLALAAVQSGLDRDIADAVYAAQGHAWTLADAPLLRDVLHTGGRHASTLAWLAVVATAATAGPRTTRAASRQPLLALAASVALATLSVATLKAATHVPCAWDLARYGGAVADAGRLARGGCFPAGHAGAGYAWMALYFTAITLAPRWRWWGLGAGVALGLAFGVAQQLRGAHVLSHDLAAAAVCWLAAVLVHAAAGRPLQVEAAP